MALALANEQQRPDPLKIGIAVYCVHLALAAAMFCNVHFDRESQGEFAWMYFMGLDWPISDLLWDYVASSSSMGTLMDWGYKWGSGANLRAFVIHGILAGLQWFALAYLATVVWRKARTKLQARGDA